MKKVLFVSLIMAVSVVVSNASDSPLIDAKLSVIRAQIEAQIERTQRAYERAETRASLVRMRAEEQVRIAEEDLTLQVERLEMLREQLCDQAGETRDALVESAQNWKQTVDRDVEKIRAEVRKANDLIQKLRIWRQNGSTDGAEGTSTGAGSACSDRYGRDSSIESTPSISGLGGGTGGEKAESSSIAELETMLEKIQQQQPVPNQPAPIAALPPPPVVRTG